MGTISLPGWENIISMPTGPKPTREQIREYYTAKRAGRQPALSSDVVTEIERRKDARDRIASSTTPKTAQAWTNVMTWLDDSQDLFSLVAFGGRIATRTAVKIFGTPTIAQLTGKVIAGSLGARLVFRIIPGLGWVLLGADILKLLTLLASIIQPFFVGMCHGWSKGLAGAIPAMMMGNAAKLVGHGITGLNPFSRTARLARAAKFSGKLFRFGEALEMAQAMKTLTGYGLTLGGIMGTLTESAYALELAARGQAPTIAVPGGGRISLNAGDATAYSPGSSDGLANIYRAIANSVSNPADKIQALSNADELKRFGL